MKNTIFTLLAGLACAMFVGCSMLPKYNTGCTNVDVTASEMYGISVTNFTDNPFVADIYYDYSQIKDFDESKLTVELAYNPSLNSDEYDNSSLEQWKGQYQGDRMFTMMEIASLDPKSPRHWTVRPAQIISREPGHVKIFSLDDLGTYTLKYGESKIELETVQ